MCCGIPKNTKNYVVGQVAAAPVVVQSKAPSQASAWPTCTMRIGGDRIVTLPPALCKGEVAVVAVAALLGAL